MDELGRILKTRREELGYSIEDVMDKLKFSKNAIDDLENSTKLSFDDPVFFNLYLKKYANFLELDYDKLVDYYDVFERTQTVKIDPDELKRAQKKAKKAKKKNVKIKTPFLVEHFSKIIIILLLLLIAYFGWSIIPKMINSNLFGQNGNNSEINIPEDNTEAPEENNETPDDEKTPNDENEEVEETLDYVDFNGERFHYILENANSLTLDFEFSGECWMGIYDQDNQAIEEFTQTSGVKSIEVDKQSINLNIGNHHAVRIFVNGIELVYETHSQNDYKIDLEVK